MSDAKHCLDCGEEHSGECDPGSFEYFQCKHCTRKQVLPWDALAFGGGLRNIICGCGKAAEDHWKNVPHDEWKALEESI
jgi:hypothetical protein